MAGIHASTHLLLLMAQKGMVSPEEVEEFYNHLMASLAAADNNPSKDEHDQFVATFEPMLASSFAVLRRVARERWKGGQESG